MAIGYLIRTELKKLIGDAAQDSRTCFVLPPPESKLDYSLSAEKAFDVAVEAIRQHSRHPVIEEVSRRRVFVEDLRPLRNSLLLEQDGWRCYGLRT